MAEAAENKGVEYNPPPPQFMPSISKAPDTVNSQLVQRISRLEVVVVV
jgi:hypothetical protein